jgi:hypothetical protein
MRATIVLLAVFAGRVWGQTVEPSSDMMDTPAVILAEDVDSVQGRVIRDLGELKGAAGAGITTAPLYNRRSWTPEFPHDSWMAKNCALMDFTIFEVSWMPPKPSAQIVSKGGSNLIPELSKIEIVVGWLRGNRRAVVVWLAREWKYNAQMHFPYTEIPLWRSGSSRQGSYASDHDWLTKISTNSRRAFFTHEVEYSPDILKALQSINSEESPKTGTGVIPGATR